MTTTVPHGLPAWSRQAAIGDYDGDPLKRSSDTEGATPYAASIYNDLQGARGSAYSKSRETLVHCENLALARFWSAIAFRTPEKVRANATPARSDEKLPEWVEILGIPVNESDPKWLVRQRCVAHYRAALGPTYNNVYTACSDLLGDLFVGLNVIVGTDLDNPPSITFWPGVNPGPASYSIGHGAWVSERSHITVLVSTAITQDPSLLDLLNVQLFQLLDRMLPAKCTFNWATSFGFLLDISQMDFYGIGA